MAVRHLLSETNAAAVIASAKLRTTTAEAALREAGTEEETLPLYDQVSLGVLLEPHPEINEDKVHVPGYYIDETDRNVMILHSSGTTGLPKAIFTSHQYLLSFTTCHELPYNSQTEQPCLSTLPLYHGFGLIAPLLSMGVGMPFCIPSSSGIPTGRSIADLLRRSSASSLITVPSILEEISLLPGDEGIRLLQDLSFVTFGGGQIKPSVGQTLSGAGVRLVNHYGTTESGPLAPLFIPGSDYSYQYFRLRKDIKLHVAPAPDAADGVPRFSLTTYPPGWGVEFLIQDQLVQNPLCPGSDFNAVGRNDAVIVLATGEKVLPSILETQLLNDERLSAVVAFGDGQFEIGIIVQPGPHVVVQSPEAFKQDIWPLIQRANEDMDAQGRVSSLDLVIYVPPNQTLPRSDKGSIMRREVIHHFEAEINKIYQDLEQRACDDNTTRFDMNMLEDQLQEYIQTSLGWKIPEGQWSQDDDLFELGMDSLQALQLRRQLLGAIPSSGELGPASVRVTRDFVYTHPSISQMAKALRGSDGLDDDSLVINKLLAEFTGDTPYNTQLEDHNDSAILLTGTTGSLGAHILAKLVSLPSATRIVCLLRPQADTHPVIRLREALSAKGLNIPDRAWSRIEVIESDMAKPNLGLSKVWYAELRSHVTHIVHAAWPMDFKRKVHSFRHAFQSLQNLILLAQHAREDRPQIRPRLVFVSSIAVVGQYSNVTGESLIPEVPMTDSSCTNHIGYAQAKLICERMLEDAGSKNEGKIETTYVRVGQMSGSSATGFWNEKEHFPALVAASQAIGKLPKLRGVCDFPIYQQLMGMRY
jgi:UDP-glucose 4-epimerase